MTFIADEEPLRPGDAATRIGVTVPTLKRWAAEGRIAYIRTPGGHYRYTAEDVERIRKQRRLQGK